MSFYCKLGDDIKGLIIDIHQIPNEFNEHYEVDFYCSNGLKVYLLRFRHLEIEDYKTEKNKYEYPSYLITELPIQKHIG